MVCCSGPVSNARSRTYVQPLRNGHLPPRRRYEDGCAVEVLSSVRRPKAYLCCAHGLPRVASLRYLCAVKGSVAANALLSVMLRK